MKHDGAPSEIRAEARKVGEHTWVLPQVDPATSMSNTIRNLRSAGATKAAERLERRAQTLTLRRA